MLELWKEAVYENKAFDVLITDLSKIFHCLSHKLLIAKLDAYGLELLFLKVPCVKRVRILSYSGPYFPAFGMNAES